MMQPEQLINSEQFCETGLAEEQQARWKAFHMIIHACMRTIAKALWMPLKTIQKLQLIQHFSI